MSTPAPASGSEIAARWRWHHEALTSLREILLQLQAEHREALRPEPAGRDLPPLAEPERRDLLEELQLEAAELTEVNAALERLRQGTYGICERTGRPIALDQLRAQPWVRCARETGSQNSREFARNEG